MNENSPSESDFLHAMNNDDQGEIIRLFPITEFFVIDMGSEESSDSQGGDESVEGEEVISSALTAEMDDYVALIAFTSSELVENFCDESDELFEPDSSIPCLIMTGAEIIEWLPGEMGILFNPESEDAFVFSPDVFQSYKSEMNF
jgi:hypothetical protein